MAELQHSASLFKNFPVGWVVRNTGNKAQLRPAGAGSLPELGNKVGQEIKEDVSKCRSSSYLNSDSNKQFEMKG